MQSARQSLLNIRILEVEFDRAQTGFCHQEVLLCLKAPSPRS